MKTLTKSLLASLMLTAAMPAAATMSVSISAPDSMSWGSRASLGYTTSGAVYTCAWSASPDFIVHPDNTNSCLVDLVLPEPGPNSDSYTEINVHLTVMGIVGNGNTTPDGGSAEAVVKINPRLAQIKPTAIAAPANPAIIGLASKTLNFTVGTAADNAPPSSTGAVLKNYTASAGNPILIDLSDIVGATAMRFAAYRGTYVYNETTRIATFTPDPGVRDAQLVAEARNSAGNYVRLNNITISGVSGNQAPAAKQTTQTFAYGAPISIALTGTDPEAGALTFGTPIPAQGFPGYVILGGGTLTVTFSQNYYGQQYVRYVATDDQGSKTESVVLVTVQNPAISSELKIVELNKSIGTKSGYGAASFNIDAQALSIPSGQYTFRLTANNAANQTAVSNSSIYVDVDKPSIVWKSPAAASCASGLVRFEVEAEDVAQDAGIKGSNIQLAELVAPGLQAFDVIQSAPGRFEVTAYDTRILTDGNIEFIAIASDRAGNSSTQAKITLNVDNTAPSNLNFIFTPGLLGAQNLMRGDNVVSASAQDAGCGLASMDLYVTEGINETKVKTMAGSPLSYTWATASWADGDHSLKIKATDVGGNVSTKIIDPISIDNSLPTVTLTAPANLASVQGTASVSATAADNIAIAKVEFFVDGALAGSDLVSPYSINWNTVGLTQGAHTVQAKATDIAGNVGASAIANVTVNNGAVDTTLPTVSISAPAVNAFVKGTVSFDANATDNVGVTLVEFIVDGILKGSDTTSPYSYSFNTASVADGIRSLTVKAYDAVGNVRTSTARSITIDNELPSVSLSAPANGDNLKGTVAVSAVAADNAGVVKVEFYVDGSMVSSDSAAPYSFNLNTALQSDGSHVLTARAYDAAGNVRMSAAINAIVDNAAPSVSITNPLSGAVVNGVVSVEAGASDNIGVAQVAFTIDGVLKKTLATSPYAYNWDTATMSNGNHTILITASDAAGNSASVSENVLVAQAINSLAVDINGLSDGVTVKGSVNLDLSANATGGIGQVVLLIDGVAKLTKTSAPFAYAWDTTLMPNGSHTVLATILDLLGGSAQTSFNVTVDNEAPTTVVLSPAAAAPVKGTISVSGTAADNIAVSKVELFVDGVSQAQSASSPYNFNWNTNSASSGSHALLFKSYDAAGNIGTSASVNVTVDNKLPVVSISTPADGASVRGTVTVTAIASDNVGLSKVELYLDGVLHTTLGSAPYTLSWNSTLISDGNHAWLAKAYDTAGNVTNSAAVTVMVDNIDTEAPSVSLSGVGNALSGTVTLNASASDNTGVSRVDYYLDNALIGSATTAPFSFAFNTGSISAGSHTLKAVAIDAAGNQGTGSLSNIVIDNTAPAVTSLSPANGADVAGTIVIQTSGSDNNGVALIEIIVDGNLVSSRANSTSATFSLDTTALSNGSHSVTVRITDAAGNKTMSTNTVDVQNVSAQIPVVAFDILNPKNGAVVAGSVPLKIRLTSGAADTVTFKIDGGAAQNANMSGLPTGDYGFTWITKNVVSEGTHSIQINAANAGGTTSQTVTVRVDNTAPVISITNPTADKELFLLQNLKANVDDAGQPLELVKFRIGTQDIAVFPGNSDVTNKLYSYAFDTAQTDSANHAIYPDGSYMLVVIAIDKAGNTTQTQVPFSIINSNLPPSSATVTWTPTSTCLVDASAAHISATVANGVIDPAGINDSSLKVFVTQNGEEKWMPGTVTLSGNTLHFNGTVPSNSHVKAVITTLLQDSTVVRQSFNFDRAMDPAVGGAVTFLPESVLTLNIPAGALSKPALIEIKKLDSSAQALVGADLAVNEQAVKGQEVIYGPVYIGGSACDGSDVSQLIKPGEILFKRDISSIPPSQQSSFVDAFETLKTGTNGRPLWATIGRSVSPFVNGSAVKTAGTPSARSVSVPVERLGTFRVTSFPAPGPGITEFINYPNPFNPSKGPTTISYMLGDNSEVTITIYDLLGNLVQKTDIAAGSVGGQANINEFPWYGKNGAGDTVGNGGYIVQIIAKDSHGNVTKARRKIGVYK